MEKAIYQNSDNSRRRCTEIFSKARLHKNQIKEATKGVVSPKKPITNSHTWLKINLLLKCTFTPIKMKQEQVKQAEELAIALTKAYEFKRESEKKLTNKQIYDSITTTLEKFDGITTEKLEQKPVKKKSKQRLVNIRTRKTA